MYKKILMIVGVLFSLYLPLQANEKIVFGLTGTVYKGDLQVFKQWQNFLQKQLNIPVELKFSRTYAEMISLIHQNEVDIAYVCNSTFVKLENENAAKLISIPNSTHGDVYYSYIIAKKETGYEKLSDFKNKLFAFTDPGSNSGAIAPTYELLQKGFKPKRFFNKTIYTYEHGESIRAVFEEFVDGASVDSLVYEQFVKRYPMEAKEMRVVEKLGPFLNSPLIANTLLNQTQYEKIQEIFLKMHETKEGQKILSALSLNRLELPNDRSYEQISEMLQFIEAQQ